MAKQKASKVLSPASIDRPTEFKMAIQGSMLEALGINMYTSIGKCLVEFAANSHDSDAKYVDIQIPFDRVISERNRIRSAAKKKAKKNRERVKIVLDPLPDDVAIVIRDSGHGMSANEIQKKYLPLNRNRRLNEKAIEDPKLLLTESGKRRVMGRKGLGKLAAFGAALKVTIQSKRKGDSYATKFSMDYNAIQTAEQVSEVVFKPIYIENQPKDEHGTTITLNQLRCDALKSSSDAITGTLLENFFGIDDKDFEIKLNGSALQAKSVDYEFTYPEHRPHGDFAKKQIVVPEGLGEFDIKYKVLFRARLGDPPLAGREKWERGSLPGTKRGARIYCNLRLAAGPSLLEVHSGTHNFNAQAYMECIVHADALDAQGVDLINTNRSDFRRDNDIVDALVKEISDIMTAALFAHSKFRDEKVGKQLEESDFGKGINARLNVLSKRAKKRAQKMLRYLAGSEGVNGQEFKTTAPLLLDSINAGDVLVKLVEISESPKDLSTIAASLAKLAEIERSDALKLYRGRRSGIQALEKLMAKADEQWKKSGKFEDELHTLLKDQPWLIKPEYSRYVTSNNQLGTTMKRLNQQLKIDEFAKLKGKLIKPNDRADLVFLAGDAHEPSTVTIVELKSPNIPLNTNHWTQLETYITQVEQALKTEQKKPVRVHGHLIGTLPDTTTKDVSEQNLLKKWGNSGPSDQIELLPLNMLLSRSRDVHLSAINVLEAEDDDGEDDKKN